MKLADRILYAWYQWRRRDRLTGAFDNRKLQSDFAAALQNSRHIAYVLADLDEFKSVNDKYGHHVGDEALRGVVKAFAGECASDHNRLGPYRQGEAFSVILTDASADVAVKFADALRHAVEEIRIDGCPDLKITARFAVVTGAADGQDGDAFRIEAHNALYCHPDEKKRNQVVHVAC